MYRPFDAHSGIASTDNARQLNLALTFQTGIMDGSILSIIQPTRRKYTMLL